MIRENIESVRARIAAACRRAGRDTASVTLVAVSKTVPADRIAEAAECGIRDFGENYVQELRGKRDAPGGADLRWHFTGHLQANKARHLAGWIHLIHSLDSQKTAGAVSKAGAASGRTIPVLIEVNTTGEPTKFGCRPEDTLALARLVAALPSVRLEGLMTIGPLPERPEDARPAFRLLARLRDRLRDAGLELPALSMGMTGDFEVAIEEGATHVRIGTAIFGPRSRRTTQG